MADFVFNIAKGRRGDDWATADIRVLLLTTAETDNTLKDYDTISALLAGSSVEATTGTITGYARVALTGETTTTDDTNDRVDFDANDADFGTLGNGANASVAAAVVYKHVGADTSNIPITKHDLSFTTDGSNVTLQWATDGIWRAS